MEYLGRHTSISYLSPSDFPAIPYLCDNDGRLPPFIIATGDGRRVAAAAELLALEEPLLLHECAAKRLGLKGRGRVAMGIGVHAGPGGKIPLLVVETQMGMPAVEVVLREILPHCALSYVAGARRVESDAVYLIRAGTCGGINAGGGPVIRAGDLINAEFSIGWSGATLQSMGGLQYDDAEMQRAFRRAWQALGLGFTADGRYPLAENDPHVVRAIAAAARELKLPLHSGGNFSKDSLYAEAQEGAFAALREHYGVLSTEMEQIAVAQTAALMRRAGLMVKCGLVSGVVGVLPEGSFVEDHAAHAQAERRMLQTAAAALSLLSRRG